MNRAKFRYLDDGLERCLRIRTVEHARSMAVEVQRNLSEAMHRMLCARGGVEPDLPGRELMHEPRRRD